MNIRLYRGISSDDFKTPTNRQNKITKQKWKSLLERRAQGNYSYPNELNSIILELEMLSRLDYQHFTDNKKIATSYAKKSKGLVIELGVPLIDVMKYFELEFQNFKSRKKQFEIVYRINGTVLNRFSKAWSLKVGKAK